MRLLEIALPVQSISTHPSLETGSSYRHRGAGFFERDLDTRVKRTEGLQENRYQCPLNCGRNADLNEAGLWRGASHK